MTNRWDRQRELRQQTYTALVHQAGSKTRTSETYFSMRQI